MHSVIMEERMTDRLLSITEAASVLGLKPKTLYQWSWKKRGIAFVKVGRSLRIREKDLVAFIERQTTQPT